MVRSPQDTAACQETPACTRRQGSVCRAVRAACCTRYSWWCSWDRAAPRRMRCTLRCPGGTNHLHDPTHNGTVRPPSLMSPLHTRKNFCARAAACSASHRTWCEGKALLGDGVLARPDTATAATPTGAVSRLGRQAPATLKVPIGTAPCPRTAIPGRPADVVVAADAKGPVARTSSAKGTSRAAAHRGGGVAGAGAGGPSRVAGGVHAVVVTASRKKGMHRRAIHRTHFSSMW